MAVRGGGTSEISRPDAERAALIRQASHLEWFTWLSVIVVLGLLAQLALNAWWVDSVTSLAILWFLIKEGREAWAGKDGD